MDTYDYKSHWNNVYQNTLQEKLGWYEENPEPSLTLIKKYASLNDAIINIGSGTSTLIDELLKSKFTNLIATDLSEVALAKLEKRLKSYHENVTYVVDDLTNPSKLAKLNQVDIWHDRAVFHFFTQANDQKTYFDLLSQKVKVGGYAILAAFHTSGAEKCSRLPVFRYSKELLNEKLGNQFNLVESFEYEFINPNGDSRPYIYAVFQKF